MSRIPRPWALAVWAVALLAAGAARAQDVSLTLQPDTVLNRIDEKVYGHFLEHIYHSVNGGLWGEVVWNRSFEDIPGAGGWAVRNGELVQRSSAQDVRLPFGDAAWKDYEFTVEARKDRGAEGFLILVRAADPEQFYWANLGGWQNSQHALEKGTKGQRQRIVSPIAKGQIETGKWYKVRVRCEGPRIQVWLDGQPVIDFTDKDRPHLAGGAGVGTWGTQARFRNLRVATLEGKELFAGLPPVNANQGMARHWSFYGQGQATRLDDNALNGDRAQVITSTGDEAGLAQANVNVKAGDALRGSVWLRGEAPGGCVVRLKDGGTVLAEAKLPAPSAAAWQEFPVTLQPNASATSATLQVGVLGKGSVQVDQVSLMPESCRATGGFRPDLLKAVADLRAPVIRWPGGCYAEHYRWKDGVGPQSRRGRFPISIWDDVDVNSYGTDEFLAMCRKVGTEPLLVINIGSHRPAAERGPYLQEAVEWIEYCNGPVTSAGGKLRAANGHPEPYGVKLWEIDNEVWFRMKPADYAADVRRFAAALKKVDPSITIIACGSGGLGGVAGGNRSWGLDWNKAVLDGCADVIDILSTHHYEGPDNFDRGARNMEKFCAETGKLIKASKNPNVKIFVSEWNAQSTDWRTGLYAGGTLNGFERTGDVVTVAAPALFLRHCSARDWDNAFINFDHTGWFPAPNYVVMKLWRDRYAPERIAVQGEEGPLNGVATRSADGKTLYYKVVNPSGQDVKLSLRTGGGFAPAASARLELVAPGSLRVRNTLAEPAAVAVKAQKVAVKDGTVTLTLPAHSAAVVTLNRQP